MDFGSTIATRFFLWPYWHQFTLILYFMITIIFTIAAIRKSNVKRKRSKIFEKLEISMLKDRKDTEGAEDGTQLSYKEALQRQLTKQGLTLPPKPVISRFIVWQAIIIMILANIVNVFFAIDYAETEVKVEEAPEQMRAAQNQLGVEFDEDKDLKIPPIKMIGRVWHSSHVQNIWVFDLVFLLVLLVTTASTRDYWREAWRLVKQRKMGIISFYIFSMFLLVAVLDSLTWRDLKLDDFGNANVVQTTEVNKEVVVNGKKTVVVAKQDIQELPEYKQRRIGDPMLSPYQRSIFERILSVYSNSDEWEQGYSAPFADYCINQTKLMTFRHHFYIDIPENSPDIRINLAGNDPRNNADVDLFYRYEKPVQINHSYKPINKNFIQPKWITEPDEYYPPKNNEWAQWFDKVYTEELIADGAFDDSEVFENKVIKNPKKGRLYLCLVAWNRTTGQPAIIGMDKMSEKSKSGIESSFFEGKLKVSYLKLAPELGKTPREDTGATQLIAELSADVVFPFSAREKAPTKHLHIFGTSKVGKDTFFEAMKGIRTGIIIGIVTTMIAIPFSLIFGIIAGYFGGWVDDIIVYIYSVLGNIPSLLLIAAFILLFGQGIFQLCLIMGITSWVGLCRLLRGETYKLREMEYVQAAEAFGVSKFMIIFKHLMPNLLHIVMISAILRFSGLVQSEVILTYLQIGVKQGSGSWGKMIILAREELSRDPAVWWPLLAAFVLMLILILTANLFADAVRDALDPRLRTK